MAKHVAEVTVTGNAEEKLDKIADGFSKATAAAKSLGNANAELSGVNEKLEGIANTVKAGFMAEMGSKIGEMGAKMSSVFSELYGKAKETFTDIVKEAATFQDIKSSLKFAFGSESEGIFEQVKKDAADLTFTLADVSELAASLGRMKINPFGGMAAEDQLFVSKTGEKIRALAVLQDTADAVGKSTQDLTASIRNVMSGDWVSLQDRFDIPKDKIKSWKSELEKLKTPQEKYNALIKNLAEMFGGAGALKAGNWNKIIAQIPDLLQQLKAAIGESGMDVLTESVGGLVFALADMVKDKEFIAAMGAAFKLLASALAAIVNVGAKAVTFLRHLIVSTPYLPILAMGLLIAVGAGLAFAGAMFTVTAGVMAATAAFAALEAEMLLPALVMLPLIALAFVALGGAILVGYAAFQIFANNMGGISDSFNNARVVLGAVVELIQSYNGETGTMSEETAHALKELGLFDTVVDIFQTFHKAAAAFEAFKLQMTDMGELIAPVFLPMMDELKDLFFELGEAMGFSGGSSKDWSSVAKDLAFALMDVAHGIITIIRWGVHIARLAVHFGAVTAASWTLKGIFYVMVGAMMVFIAGAALMAAPFIVVAGIVAGILASIMKLVAVVKGLKSGGLDGAKAAWDKDLVDTKGKDGKGGMPKMHESDYQPNVDPFRQRREAANSRGRDGQGKWIGLDAFDPASYNAKGDVLSQEEQARIARGGDKRIDPTQGAKTEDFDSMYRRGARGVGEAAAPTATEAKGGGPGPRVDPNTGHERVATAITAQNAALTGIQTALSAFSVSVNIDGAEVAKAVNNHKAGAGGAA